MGFRGLGPAWVCERGGVPAAQGSSPLSPLCCPPAHTSSPGRARPGIPGGRARPLLRPLRTQRRAGLTLSELVPPRPLPLVYGRGAPQDPLPTSGQWKECTNG